MVVQQDSYIEDQRQVLSERSSSCASLSRHSSRPSSLIEQEKQRSLEKHRQELTSLQRQQAAHAEERRKREREWERREQQVSQREELVHLQVTIPLLPPALFLIRLRADVILNITAAIYFHTVRCFDTKVVHTLWAFYLKHYREASCVFCSALL